LLISSEDCRFLFDDGAPLLVVTSSADCVVVVRKIGADLFRVEIRRRYEVEVLDGSALFLMAASAAAAAASAFLS
jgi:hypothetical protein